MLFQNLSENEARYIRQAGQEYAAGPITRSMKNNPRSKKLQYYVVLNKNEKKEI